MKKQERIDPDTGEVKNMTSKRVPWMEYPDPTPVDVPVHFKRPPSIQEQIKAMVRGELSRHAEAQGMESFEEADDFDVDDDDGELASPYELHPMQEEAVIQDASNLDKPEPPVASPQSPQGEVKPTEGNPSAA